MTKPTSAAMQSTSERESAKFVFNLPPANSLKQLVNNEFMADVVFKVGQSGELIYAHKMIITLASEVFFAQFNGSFVESQRDIRTDPILIEDIEPVTFLELLRYIYCREVNLQPGNMLDMYYISDKYMLGHLKMLCEDNFSQLIKENSVLEIFQHNRRYGFSVVDELCLEIIWDNPLKYFEQEQFLTLSQQALELIVSKRAMNCGFEQLDRAINKWERSNKETGIEVQLEKLICRKLYFYDKCMYSSNIDTKFVLKVQASIALYGIGIYVGVENDSPVPNSTVTLRVNINGLLMEKTVPVVDELMTYQLMCEKQIISEQCEIRVTVSKQDCLKDCKMFHLTAFSMMSKLGKSMLTICNVSPSTIDYTYSDIQDSDCERYCRKCHTYFYGTYCNSCVVKNCVAYLLCK